jgi:hypothetical protein
MKTRTVFGRRRLALNGATFIIQLEKDALTVRRLWAREAVRLTLAALVARATGELDLSEPKA